MSEHLYTYDDPPSERDLTKACQILERMGFCLSDGRDGLLVAMPAITKPIKATTS